MTPVEHLTKKHQYPGWVGSPEALKTLLVHLEASFEDVLATHVARKTRYSRTSLEEATTRVRDTKEQMEGTTGAVLAQFESRLRFDESEMRRLSSQLEVDEADARKDLQLKADLYHKEGTTRSVEGTADELMTTIQAYKRFTRLHVQAPSGAVFSHRAALLFDDDGLETYVNSSHNTWAEGTHAHMADLIKPQIPNWQLVRNPLFSGFFGGAAAYAIIYSLMMWVVDLAEGDAQKTTYSVLAYIFSAVWFVVGGTMLKNAVHKLIPAFEITEAGSKSRGATVLAVVGGSAVTVFLALFAKPIGDLLF